MLRYAAMYTAGQFVTSLDARSIERVRNKKCGIVFQDFVLIDELTVAENVMGPLLFSGVVKKRTLSDGGGRPYSRRNDQAEKPTCLDAVGRTKATGGSAYTLQICSLYCDMLRSAANAPEAAMLCREERFQARGSRYFLSAAS